MSPRLVADKYGRLPPSPTESKVLKVIERRGSGVEERWLREDVIWRHCREHGMTHAQQTIRNHVDNLTKKGWLTFEYKDSKRRRGPRWKLKDARFLNTCSDCEEEFKSMELDYLCELCRHRSRYG